MEYTISEQQKQTVTGVRNQLWQQLQTMNPDDATAMTYAELQDLVQRLEQVVQPLDQIDSQRMEVLIDYYGGCADEHGFSSRWSMWEDPTGQLDRVWMSALHPYAEGTVIEYDATMGNGEIHCVEIAGPLWIDVWRACDQAIKMSGDDHHIFIEQLRATADGVLALITGS